MPARQRPPRSGTVRISLLATKVRSRMVFMVLDGAVVLVAYSLAEITFLRNRAPVHYLPRFVPVLVTALIVQLFCNSLFGLYGRIWRHAGVEEAQGIVAACLTTLAALLTLHAIGFTNDFEHLSFQTMALGCLLTMMGIGVIRFHSRLLGWQRAHRGMGLRVGIIGSGDAGAAVVREMLRNPKSGLFPVAVFDDDRRTHGLSLMGVPVLGCIDDVPQAVTKLGIQQLLVAMPSPSTTDMERCLRAGEEAKVVVKIVPDLPHIVGTVTEPSISVRARAARDVRIEDLLGRREVVTDLAAVGNALGGRRVLVTGAGGSIGSEICRQVAGFDPEILVMLDHDETHLYDAAARTEGKCEQVLADVSCRDAIEGIFSRWRPDVVFHAAAHKHVPILETHVVEAVTTNVLGTRNVLDAAAACGAERFVLVSTDKAVRPSNVMGATKRLGELLVRERAPRGRPYCAVRFGNVLGSRGSVIPTFQRQIAAGGPVTVTDPHMTRFFMSVEEAVQLVLQSSVLANGSDIYMLEMGEPISILDLAHRMVRLSGLNVGTDISIRITGPRVGEKLHEQLLSTEELVVATDHPSVLRVTSPPFSRHLDEDSALSELELAIDDRNEVRARRILFDLVREDEVAEPQLEREVVLPDPYALAEHDDIPA